MEIDTDLCTDLFEIGDVYLDSNDKIFCLL